MAYADHRKTPKRTRAQIRREREFETDIVNNLEKVRTILLTGEWDMHPEYRFTRMEHGKMRDICYNPSPLDSVIEHALNRTVGRILEASCITDTFSGFKKRGCIYGKKRIESYLAEYPDDSPIYVLKLDIRHFYESINREKLEAMIARKIKDKTILKLMHTRIYWHEKGIPLGNRMSGPMANYYLSPLDHLVKETLGFRHYARYCDDIVVISNSKAKLKDLLVKMRECCASLDLEIKPNVQIFPIERHGIDFMGYVFRRHDTILRKRIERNLRMAYAKFRKAPNTRNYTSLASIYGWAKHVTRFKAFWNAVVGRPLKELHELTIKSGNMNMGKCA